MRDRADLVLKAVCLALAALVGGQLLSLALRPDPLRHVKVPAPASPRAEADHAGAPRATNATPSNSSAGQSPPPAPLRASPPAAFAVGAPFGFPGLMAPPGLALGGPGPTAVAADLPAEVRARLDRVYESELLGPVVRPPPMALLGIAGKDVFLRAPNGQTGLLREGEELGGVKLLRIGTNRVLVEHEGRQQELTLFAGLGSEPLLPKPKEKSP